jgi:hypothetical protein
LVGELGEGGAVPALVDAVVVHEQACGRVDGERFDGIEGGAARAQVVAAAVAFDGVTDLGQLLEVALQRALADATLPGEVGGGAGAGGQECDEPQAVLRQRSGTSGWADACGWA